MQRHRLAAIGAVLALGATTAVVAPQLVDAGGPAPTPAAASAGSRSTAKTAGRAAAGDVPQATATANPGLYVPITPYRTYDSRDEPQPWVPGEYGDIDAVTDVDGILQIPATATAVTFNVTAVTVSGLGFVQILAPGGARGETSTVNWSAPNQFIANGGSVGLVARALQVYVGGTANAAVDILIDITGYYITPA